MNLNPERQKAQTGQPHLSLTKRERMHQEAHSITGEGPRQNPQGGWGACLGRASSWGGASGRREASPSPGQRQVHGDPDLGVEGGQLHVAVVCVQRVQKGVQLVRGGGRVQLQEQGGVRVQAGAGSSGGCGGTRPRDRG